MVTSNYVTKITLTIQGSRRNAAFFMRIIENQLDYDDVLILPNRSTISSRKEVNLDRTFKFYYSPKEWTGIPIITANMPCLGIESVAEILRSYKIITCLHKYYTVQEILDILWNQGTEYTWISIGLNEQDKIRQLAGIEPNIVIDVPNGYMSSFPDYCKEIRELSPNSIITCGNVCTLEMAQELILHGKVDLVKTGIGPGCFVAGSHVYTKDGFKNIEDIQIGDEVLTHTGDYQKVTNTFTKIENERIYDINGIKCTKTHEFYVVHKNDASLVTELNIHKYAKWVSAEDLTDDYLLIELTE